MSAEPKSKKYRKAIDLEAVNNTDVTGIGLAVMDDEGVTVFKQEWWIRLTDSVVVDPMCKKYFWDKFPEVWDHMIKEGKEESEQIKDFVKTYDEVHKTLGVEEDDIILVSDNPEFDFGGLRPYVRSHCNRDSLRYTSKGSYRSIRDNGEASWLLGIADIIESDCKKIQVHDHFPSNDAEHNLISDLVTGKVIDAIKERLGDKIKDIATEISKTTTDEIIKKRKKE